MKYRVVFTERSDAHLNVLPVRHQRRVVQAITEQLVREPTVPTRNRKLMRSNLIATWELRIGDFRVYYDVELEPERRVVINAVGVKRGNRVFAGGEEIELS